MTFQYENDLLEELSYKSLDYDECVRSRATNDLEQDALVNSIQNKLFRMQVDYAKRFKIQDLCYKKKFSDFQKKIKELNRQMEVS